MSEHTKGKWMLVDQGMHIFGDEKYAICSIRGYNTKEGKANARRIVAAINACDGIDTDVLESTDGLNDLYRELQQQRDKLLNALINISGLTEKVRLELIAEIEEQS